MRVAERHAFLHEVVRNVCRGRKTARRRKAHLSRIERDILQKFGKNRQAVEDGLFRVEERFLVFLQVFVVRSGYALDDGEDRHKTAVNSARFAADEFGNVGVLFLRHDGRARGIGVGYVDESEFVRRIDDKVFAETRKVRHDGRAAENIFRDEIPVRHSVDGVLRDLREGEQRRRHAPVDRKICSRERAAAEGHHVGAFIAVGKALEVAQKHFAVRVYILRNGDGLRFAHMRVSRHDVLHVVVCNVEQGIDERFDVIGNVDDAVLHIQTKVGRYLVVARARGVHLFALSADAFDELVFHKGMYVFRALDGKVAFFDVGKDVYERVADRVGVFFGDDLRFP